MLEWACASELIDRVSLVTGVPWHRNWGPNPEATLQILIFRDHWHPLILRYARAIAAKVRGVRRWRPGALDGSSWSLMTRVEDEAAVNARKSASD